MNAAEYALALKQRLPEGDAWNSSEETDGTTALDGLINALAQEPARIDADGLALLNKVIPDNVDTDLDAWEKLVSTPTVDLTDAERLARIRGILQPRGELDLSTLQLLVREHSGSNAVLYNRLEPECVAGGSTAGDGCGSHAFNWLCEMYDHISVGADDFESWTSFASVTNAADQSPVTLDATAATATISPGGGAAFVELTAGDDETVFVSLWIKPANDETLTLAFQERDGATQTAGQSYDLTADVWHRVTYEDSVGSGSSEPLLMLLVGSSLDCSLSWLKAGVRDNELEARISEAFQEHTRGTFAVFGEFSTLLAQDPLEVTF